MEPRLLQHEEQETQNKARREFLTYPLGKLIRKHALPAVASMMFMAFYQIADGIMVGRSLGPEALASVNILYPVLALLAGLGVMIGVGGNARIAVLLGAGESRKASGVLSLIVSLGIGLGIAGSLITLALRPQILALLGTSGQLGHFAGEYLIGLLPFFAFMILVFILEQSVRNDGRPNLASGIMAACALLNIGLDYLFLFVLEWGITGAAVATGLSQSIGALIFAAYFLQKTLADKPGLCYARPQVNQNTLLAVVVNGSSEMFNSLATGVTIFLFNRMILAYVGDLGVAAFALVQYLMMLGMMVVIGICNGTQPIFSYNHGAGEHRRVQGALWRVAALCTGVGAAVFFLMGWQAEPMAALFLPEHPEALALTLEVAWLVRWSMLFMPAAMLGSVYFTALEQAGKSLSVAVSRGLLLPVLGLALFPAWWGAAGIWITPAFAEGVAVLVAAGCFLRKKEMRQEKMKAARRRKSMLITAEMD